MKFLAATTSVALTTLSLVQGFGFSSLKKNTRTNTITQTQQQFSQNSIINSQQQQQDDSSTRLNMAFVLDENKKGSNMFDGPLALTRERDACGVGFIANTQSGGAFTR